MFDENSNNVMAGMVNHLMNVKDSRWLQVEVCREFQRGQCSRTDQECKFAHPPPHVEVQNGKVTACYDSIKGRCTRENPKCKYLHPPQHLKDQLLINGRNNLALKNLLMSQLSAQSSNPIAAAQLVSPTLTVPGVTQGIIPGSIAAFPYYTPAAAINPTVGAIYPGLIPTAASPEALTQIQSVGGVMSAGPAVSPASLAAATAAAQQAQQKARSDRVESMVSSLRTKIGGADQNNTSHALALAASRAVAAAHAVAASAAVANHTPSYSTAMATNQGAIGHMTSSVVGGASGGGGKKRPLEPDPATTPSLAAMQMQPVMAAAQQAQAAALASGDPLLLAAAALQQQQQQQQQVSAVKRVAVEKSGVPVYQPATLQPAATPVQYTNAAQLAAIPGLQGAAYIPVSSFAGHHPSLPRF